MADLFADVASYQSSDVSYIKNLGAKGVVVKATEGTFYRNSKALDQTQSTINAGMQASLYHYAHYTSVQSAREEADFFHEFTKFLGFDGAVTMVCDIEESKIANTDVYGNTVAFVERLHEIGYPKVVVYSMYSWFATGKVPTAYPTWVANYGVSQPGVDNAAAWQYTNNYNGMNLDMSYDYTGLFTNDMAEPTTPPEAIVDPDNIVTVTADDAVGFNSNDDIIEGSFNKLKKGTQWQSHGIKIVAGEPQYLIGDDFYLPQKYTDQKGICTIKGDPAYGWQSVDSSGTGWRYSEYYFKGQTQWKVLEITTINDTPYYKVSDLDWISFDSVHGSGQ